MIQIFSIFWKHDYTFEHIFNWGNVMDTLILNKVPGLGDCCARIRLYDLVMCIGWGVYTCTRMWIKRILVESAILFYMGSCVHVDEEPCPHRNVHKIEIDMDEY